VSAARPPTCPASGSVPDDDDRQTYRQTHMTVTSLAPYTMCRQATNKSLVTIVRPCIMQVFTLLDH